MRHAALLLALSFPLLAPAAAGAIELGLPAQCTLGKDCFVQQFADDDQRPGEVADPFCGAATYDGHDGTDLRVLSMADVARGVPVVAVADGKVLRGRDGEPDRLVTSEADRAAVANKECGNGMIVDLGGGYEVQYCHLREGSLAVKPGDTVKRGQKLGEIGASGMAAFPHVHLTVRLNGQKIDPVTGHELSAGCLKAGDTGDPLFAPDIMTALNRGEAQVIALGLAGQPIDHKALPVSGPPAAATTVSPAYVGWAWLINLHKDDRVVVSLTGPDGLEIAANRSDPMDHSKADYSTFAGKKGAPRPGAYQVKVGVERGGAMVVEKTATVQVD
jgi:Peptidase family M23